MNYIFFLFMEKLGLSGDELLKLNGFCVDWEHTVLVVLFYVCMSQIRLLLLICICFPSVIHQQQSLCLLFGLWAILLLVMIPRLRYLFYITRIVIKFQLTLAVVPSFKPRKQVERFMG